MTGYIYKIINDINNKIYVGQTIDIEKRWWKHTSVANTNLNYKSHLYNAMRKYGVDHFSMEVIEECDAENMDERESYWIKELDSLSPNGYNLTPGGVVLFGENNPFYGKHHTEETKEKISKKTKGRIATEEEKEMRKVINIGENNPFFGKYHTEETKEKIKQTNIEKGNYQKTSERMKINNPNKDGEATKKPVKFYDIKTKEEICFESITSAANYIINTKNLKTVQRSVVGSICSAIKGRQKTSYDKVWEYINKEDYENYCNTINIEKEDIYEDEKRFCN